MLASNEVDSTTNCDPTSETVNDSLQEEEIGNSDVPLQIEKFHVVGSLMEVENIIREYEKKTFSRFVSDKTDRGFNRDDWQAKCKFRWKLKGFPLLDPTIPAMYLGSKLLTCQYGKDRNLKNKRKWKERQNRKRELNGEVKTYNRSQPTKKVNCPASIWIKKMATFPAYKLTRPTESSRKTAANKFWNDKTKNAKSVEVIMKYLVILPDLDIHKNHPVGESCLIEKTAKEIIQQIESLAARKIWKVSVISKHLDEFRRNTLFKNKEMPPTSSRAYFPNHKDLHNILYRYKCRNRSSPVELQQLEELVQNWSEKNPDDHFYYRRKVNAKENSSFLLCYQSKQQKRLLNLYGDLVMLDATYKTIGYSVPLYFLCVQTNVAYQIVGLFIVQKGTNLTMMDALKMFKTWNPDWNAKYFMLDFAEKEEIFLKNIFPDCKIFMSDFHREKRWESWGKCSENGVTEHIEMMMSTLRRIADASTTIDYLAAVAGLTESQVWKNSVKLQEWINTMWLPSSQKWVRAFKPTEMVFHVHNSNGLKMMAELLPFAYIQSYNKAAISNMVEEIVTNFMPTVYHRYETRNLEAIERPNIPEPVRNTPTFVVDTFIAMSKKAALLDQIDIQKTDLGTFIVKTAGILNTVYFGSSEKLPFCYTCENWERQRQPCEHFHAVFQRHPEWGWQQLCSEFRNYPSLILDHSIVPVLNTNNQEAMEAAYFVTCESSNVESECGEAFEEMDQSTSLAEKCRECLTEIKDFTFVVDDTPTLQNLLTSLEQAKCAIKQQKQVTT
ncbi:uncharacterized protein [Antedon mediterranea]|uniref:uncharacterized protein isoform X2 n=1 Tax=Antedon mediterranea TaxID=105859 RepID=UPI003AF8EB26